MGEIEIISTLDTAVRLLAATLLGMALGVERALAGKTAGVRTYALVSMGAALFVLVSVIVGDAHRVSGTVPFDPLRVASQIVVGIGFLGAGLIVFREPQVRGLTTAAGLWVAAGIGMAAGFGLFMLALFATFATLFVFTALWFFEERYLERDTFKKWYQLFSKSDKNSS